MMEAKDPAIKLFGQKIALPENGTATLVSADCSVAEDCGAISAPEDSGSDRDRSSMVEDSKVSGTEGEEEQQKDDQDAFVGKPTEANQQDDVEPLATEDLKDSRKSPDSDDKPKTPSIDEETGGVNTSKTENNQNDTNNSQKKILKKPDKILPCPRCNSMDTKFCYYNNYNVNQPRHFCKSCQRYWTAGGTMRNVPVGAGRRKSKNSASHCRPITISEALQVAQIDASNGIPPAFKASGPVLSFGSDAPLCESMTSALNLAEIKVPNSIQNGLYKLERGISVTCNGGENGDDCSSGSSITTTNSAEERSRNGLQEPMLGNMHGFPSQIPCLSGFPWPYPWNSAVSVPAPAFYPSRFPIPFYPATYWNCSIPGAWSIPWVSPQSPVMNQKPQCSGPNSPNLGKHSRDGDLLKPNNSVGKEPVEQKNPDGAILIPKTLRIDDPDEAARSSIWTTLGIKNDFNCRGGLFKAFQPKNGEKDHIAENSPALQANPAALSRSLSFQERA